MYGIKTDTYASSNDENINLVLGSEGFVEYPLETYLIITADNAQANFNITYWYYNSTAAAEDKVVYVEAP